MYIDTHCHLDFPQFDSDRAMVIGNAKKVGVKQFINPGTSLASSAKAIGLANDNPEVVFAAVGIHPHDAQHDPDVSQLKKFLGYGVVAIGECGLDYFQYKNEQALGKKDKQKRLFEEQLRMAILHNLPVIMHCREAYEDFFSVIDSLSQVPRGVIHCFSGGLEDLRMAKERKFFVGIDGNVTYSKQLWLTVPHIPLSMALMETDAPFLPPIPFRGERSEPKYIPLIAKKIAELQHREVREIEQFSTKNAQKLFFNV